MKKALTVAVLPAFLLFLASSSLHALPIPVSGRVVDANGQEIAAARVALSAVLPNGEGMRLEASGKARPAPAATVVSDALGAFRLMAPDAGMFRLRVESPGAVPVEALLTPLTQESELPDARMIPDAGLRVRVTDPSGRPLAGAWVGLVSRGGGAEPWAPDLRRRARTDADGTATLPKGRDEALSVAAWAPGFLPVKREGVRGAAVELRLAAGRPRRIEVRDPQGKAVPGVFVTDEGSGAPLGETSEAGRLDLTVPATPASGVELTLTAADGRSLTVRVKPAKAAKEGDRAPAKIVLPASLPATGVVLSAKDGLPVAGALAWPAKDFGRVVRAESDGFLRFASLSAAETVMVAAAGFFPAEGTAVAGRLPAFALQPRLTASGLVVDDAGRPVSGAAIRATHLANSAAMMTKGPNVFRSGGFARSAPSGRFRLVSLLAGVAYEVKVNRQGFAPGRLELPPRADGEPAGELRIVLHAGRTAFGTVLDGDHKPLAGAEVSLLAAAPSGLTARLRAARNPEPFTASPSDAAGRFEARNLPAGSYDLKIQARGFARVTVPGLAVPEGEGRTDLGTVSLAPGLAVRGVVVDALGNPVAAAEVRARAAEREAMPTMANRDPGPADAITADDGSFTLADRSPGESLDLAASHPGFGPGAAPGVAVPAAAPVRIVLQAAARVAGRATDADGKGIAGAEVSLVEESSVSFGGQSMRMPTGRFQRGVTDDEGGFAFDGVSPGAIVLRGSAPRHQQATLEGLEIKPGTDLTGVSLLLPAGATVEGRVLGADGRPVAEAAVAVVEASQTDFPSFGHLRAATDGDGEYRIEGVPPGAHTLEARAEGYRRAVRDVQVTPETRGADFQLDRGPEVSGRAVDDAGNPIAGVDVLLMAGRFSMDAPHALTGADGAFRFAGVQDGTYQLRARKDDYAADPKGMTVTVAGAPVAGLEVRLSGGGTITGRLTGLEQAQLSRVRVSAGSALNTGQVDVEGTYRIVHLPPGPWQVTAVVPDTSLHAEGHATLEPGMAEARLDLQFGGGHALTGSVLRNGEPLAGAALQLSGAGTASWQAATTDHQGSFRFGGLENGSYHLDVSAPSGALHREEVEISGDRAIRVELRTASLAGKVVDALDGSPLAGARVSLQNAGDGPSPFDDVVTDARGAFRLAEVGDGAWKLRAARDGYAPAERAVQVDGTPPDEVEIRLDPTEGITVEATLASGQPPDRLQVAALDAAGKTVAGGTYPTGENGRTRLANLPAGSWQLLVASDQSAPVLVAATVPGPPLHVVLPAAGQLRVTVPALASDPATAHLTLLGAGGPFRDLDWNNTATSDLELYGGARTVGHVPAGPWQIVVSTTDGRSWKGSAAVTPGGTAEVTLK